MNNSLSISVLYNIIDSNFSWKEHTNQLKIYFRCILRKFYMLKKFCSFNVLKLFYFGLFHSKLSYGIVTWGGSYANKIQPLLVLQKNIIRKICNADYRSHSLDLFKCVNVLPVRHLFYFKVLKSFFSEKHLLLSSTNSHYSFRISDNVEVPPFRTTAFRNSYPILSRRLFNKLPSYIKSVNSLNSFLKSTKTWLFNFNHQNIESLLLPDI